MIIIILCIAFLIQTLYSMIMSILRYSDIVKDKDTDEDKSINVWISSVNFILSLAIAFSVMKFYEVKSFEVEILVIVLCVASFILSIILCGKDKCNIVASIVIPCIFIVYHYGPYITNKYNLGKYRYLFTNRKVDELTPSTSPNPSTPLL